MIRSVRVFDSSRRQIIPAGAGLLLDVHNPVVEALMDTPAAAAAKLIDCTRTTEENEGVPTRKRIGRVEGLWGCAKRR